MDQAELFRIKALEKFMSVLSSSATTATMKTSLVILCLALAISTGHVQSARLIRSTEDILVFQLENGTIIEEDLSKPIIQPYALDSSKITFFAYNKDGSEKQVFTGDVNSVKQSGFDSSKETKIFIHGYTSNHLQEAPQVVKNAYVQNRDYNFFIVDYEPYNSPYLSLVNNAKPIGETVGKFLKFLGDSFGLDPAKLHIIGHSMGAHIAGYASVSTGLSKQTRRVTGLDPAGPLMASNGPAKRLDPTDASFVDCIHTSFDLGMKNPTGVSDFYPNGGNAQPRCADKGPVELAGCSHAQSYHYLAETVSNPRAYPSVVCDTADNALNNACSGPRVGLMGEAADTTPHGIYYTDVSHLLKV